MSRYSEREVERALEKMEQRAAAETDLQVLFAGHRAQDVDAEFVDGDGEPAEPDPDADTVIVVREQVVETEFPEGDR